MCECLSGTAAYFCIRNIVINMFLFVMDQCVHNSTSFLNIMIPFPYPRSIISYGIRP
jgi:hypothetical protein